MDTTTLDALDNITRLALQANDAIAHAKAAERDLAVALETVALQEQRATIAETASQDYRGRWGDAVMERDDLRAECGRLRAQVATLRTQLADCQQSERYARSEMARLGRLVAQVTQRDASERGA